MAGNKSANTKNQIKQKIVNVRKIGVHEIFVAEKDKQLVRDGTVVADPTRAAKLFAQRKKLSCEVVGSHGSSTKKEKAKAKNPKITEGYLVNISVHGSWIVAVLKRAITKKEANKLDLSFVPIAKTKSRKVRV